MAWFKKPLDSSVWPPLAENSLPFAGLLTSLPEEHDYACEVEGQLDGLNGTLYRVGPGLYDRGADRKRMMLDGDGMVQALRFRGGQAHFRNRFVRTNKFVEEAAANRFLYPTFSCHGSGPWRNNLGLSLPNQANTTVLAWGGKLWAFDEGQQPYALDDRLETLGQPPLDPKNPDLAYWAHWKLDASHHQVHCLSISQGRKPTATINSLAADGSVAVRRSIELPRVVYIHDWFVTEKHFAFLLHPAYIDFAKMLQVLIGRETFSEAIQWRPERGGVLVVAERDSDAVRTIECPACWMWHAINAYEDGDRLMLDFIGAEVGGGLGTGDSPLFQVMRGVLPDDLGNASNFLRRWEVDLAAGGIAEHVIDASANFELPGMSATERTKPYCSAFMVRSAAGELFPNAICRLDGRDLSTMSYEFGAGEYCGEPVVLDCIGGPRAKYLVTPVYSAASKRSSFALLDMEDISTGPVARIHLRHHVPVSFHGYWLAGPE
jgi:all-trans-8'-apo-beta-carotenal 15,15'-oxygenase